MNIDDRKLRLRVSNILKKYEDVPTKDFSHGELQWGEVGNGRMFIGFMRKGQLVRVPMSIENYNDPKYFKVKVEALFEKWLNKVQ